MSLTFDERFELEERVLAVAAELANEVTGIVTLLDLRAKLADVDRTDLDQTLADLDRAGDAYLRPDEDRAYRDAVIHNSAVTVNGQRMHLLQVYR